MLDEAMGGLSPEQRAVFVLRAVEEMSYEEIAGALGHQPGHGDEPALPGARAPGEGPRALSRGRGGRAGKAGAS